MKRSEMILKIQKYLEMKGLDCGNTFPSDYAAEDILDIIEAHGMLPPEIRLDLHKLEPFDECVNLYCTWESENGE